MAHYATSFGQQWTAYRRTQLDSYTGTTISRDRLERDLGCRVEALKGLAVLEAGCGAGRFTEWLLQAGARVVAVDATEAVWANVANCRHLGPYTAIQADLHALPVPEGAFDVVLCLGVLQHTPSPERAMARLAAHVRPGGLLVIDHYATRGHLDTLGHALNMQTPLRAVLRRVARRQPDVALRATKRITALCDPIRRRTARHAWLDRIVGRLLPSAAYWGMYDLPDDMLYAWNELDTFDRLTDWYKHRRTVGQVRTTLEGLGLTVERCELAGYVVEARARRPH